MRASTGFGLGSSLAGAVTLAAGVLLSTAPAGAAPSAAPTFRHVVLQDQKAYGEPSLAIAADGHVAVCVPGGAGTTSLWFSGDGGRHFGTSHTTSPNGGGDCEIDFLPNGDLLDADLEITDSNVQLSHDHGKTWAPVATPDRPDDPGAVGAEQDRQWFAHSPDGKTAYLVYHDFAAEAEFFARSTDGGKTWLQADGQNPVNSGDQFTTLPGFAQTPAQGTPASILDTAENTFSGPMLISPDGKDRYVLYSISNLQANLTSSTPPYGPSKGIVVAHAGPESDTFTNKYAVVDSDDTINGAIFPWGSIDRAGNVYVIYNSDKGSPGNFHTYYTVSTDKGTHWSAPVKVDGMPLHQGAQIYATGQGGAPGVIDLAWYGTTNGKNADDDAADWNVYFAQVRDATSAHPQITTTKLSQNTNHHGNVCLNGLLCVAGGDRSLLDFFELAIDPTDGMAEVAYADNTGFTSGTNGRVIFAKQTSGASALATHPAQQSAAQPPAGAAPDSAANLAADRAPAGGVLATTGAGPGLAGGGLVLLTLGVWARRRARRAA